MTANAPPQEEDADSAEISVVIKALSAAEDRLEALTGGEVDTIMDRGGRSYVLSRARAELRHNEAAKHAAILNALPAQIVLLNAQGLIISVNDTWRQTAETHALRDAGYGVGLNYLAICDNTRGVGAFEAQAVAAGIRSVLSGECKRYSMEYPCDGPGGRSWFLLTVAPLNEANPQGAVVMHVDITAEKRGAQDLLRFAAAMDATLDAIYLVDRSSMLFIHFNDAACRLQQQPREQVSAGGPHGAFGVSRAELERAYDGLIAGGAAEPPLESMRRRADGSTFWVEERRQAQRLGERWTIVSMVRDVTDRRLAEQRIMQLNRVHAMLSGINTLIVRVRDRPALFKAACRIAVEAGGFHMAWIGLVDRGLLLVAPVASEGVDEELLTCIEDGLSLQGEPGTAQSPAVQAIREKRVVVVVNPQDTARVVLGRKFAQAGIRSLVMLPMIVADEAVGVFALYAGAADFFHGDELTLLRELAGDVAFAIDHIDKQERLEYLAFYDPLTGLANRTLFLDRVTQHIRSAAGSGRKLALFLIDLERFKNVNDSLGRPAGDALLRQVADWLTHTVGDTALLARLDADHFAVVMPAVTREADLTAVLETALDAFLKRSFEWQEISYRFAAKTGIALYPDDGADADTLFRNAEAALKKAKRGADRYLFYAQKMSATAATRLSLENQLRLALEHEQFVLHYQPKVSLATGQLTGAEALIRWNDPHTGLVPPGAFIPILEETGLIYEVGRWALIRAIQDHLSWRKAGLAAVRIAVNVSPLQLGNRGFIPDIQNIIGTETNAAAGLELEITENLIMQDVKHSIASLRQLQEMGITVAIDDFGTGYSSLSYLAKLPINTVKIDRAFVIDMTTGPDGRALIAMIINLAHSLKFKVVAEGVETEQQAQMLRALDCDEMQGYLFSRPIPAGPFAAKFLT